MNETENELLDTDLNDTVVATTETNSTFVPADSVVDSSEDDPDTTSFTPASVADVIDSITPAAKAKASASASAPSGKVGRPSDTKGVTALGAARILYQNNSGLSSKAFKELLTAELTPKFNCSKAVIQTYVSIVRKGAPK
jgi:hypothetical protein